MGPASRTNKGMDAEVRRALLSDEGGERVIAKGPYVQQQRRFAEGPSVPALVAEPELGLHPGLAQVFPFASLHKHQELALREARAGRHLLIAAGTGSGHAARGITAGILQVRMRLQGLAPVEDPPLGRASDDLYVVLADLALAGHGVCASRAPGRVPPRLPVEDAGSTAPAFFRQPTSIVAPSNRARSPLTCSLSALP